MARSKKTMSIEDAAAVVGAAVREVESVEPHDAGTKVTTTDGVAVLIVTDEDTGALSLLLLTAIPNYLGPLAMYAEPEPIRAVEAEDELAAEGAGAGAGESAGAGE